MKPMRSIPVSPLITFFPTDDQAVDPNEDMDPFSCDWVRIWEFRDIAD